MSRSAREARAATTPAAPVTRWSESMCSMRPPKTPAPSSAAPMAMLMTMMRFVTARPLVSTGESHAVPWARAVHAAQKPKPMKGSTGQSDTR